MTYISERADLHHSVSSIAEGIHALRQELVTMRRRDSFVNMQGVLDDLDEILGDIESLKSGVDDLENRIEDDRGYVFETLVKASKQLLPAFSEEESLATHNLRMALWDVDAE